jgi:hypothetical protein
MTFSKPPFSTSPQPPKNRGVQRGAFRGCKIGMFYKEPSTIYKKGP